MVEDDEEFLARGIVTGSIEEIERYLAILERDSAPVKVKEVLNAADAPRKVALRYRDFGKAHNGIPPESNSDSSIPVEADQP